MAATASALSVRSTLRAFIKEITEGADVINREDVVEQARVHFADDTAFRAALCEEAIGLIVPEILNNMMSRSRGRSVPTATGWTTQDALQKTARERFAEMFEGTGSGYTAFLAMKAGDVAAAIELRETQVAGQLRQLGLLRDVLPKLKAEPTKTVGEIFTSRQLENLWRKHIDRND